ncbi:uncharacterized protein RAG0_10564 [Rhynchosporium agropyri]|uniref:Invertebrate defensins family profile domain-containing protein n=1 Tax=Rhynchosporium agropyri TaxID=914238 RepID=A0A1E1L2Z9_9HELO|nr:uncharacterized protein RAG0_10564 [Rhynchosporium agropyri]
MQFNLITALLFTMAAGVMAAPAELAGDGLVARGGKQCSALEIKQCGDASCSCKDEGFGYICSCE